MVGLSDMEELISTVTEKDIADYLKEAMRCYGAGAYRACVVLSHIALFDGLRKKLLFISPVNSVAKSISDEIEPIAKAQKVFELSLVHKMKAADIITQLESDILEQLNKQRNKAAHPSGHTITAEEARYVFSEVIKKFLSKPIRQTSVVVNKIVESLQDTNFFPSVQLNEMREVVKKELEGMDESAIPSLLAKLSIEVKKEGKLKSKENAENFIMAFASLKKFEKSEELLKYVINPLCVDDNHAKFISQITTCQPQLIKLFDVATKLRCSSLYIKNAKTTSVHGTFNHLHNPAHLLAVSVREHGEDFLLTEYPDFTKEVMSNVPRSPQFIKLISKSPKLLSEIKSSYIAKASSSNWSDSNTFVKALPSLDKALSDTFAGEWAFEIISAITVAANYNGFEALAMSETKFESIPELREKAISFKNASPAKASNILKRFDISGDINTFSNSYFI